MGRLSSQGHRKQDAVVWESVGSNRFNKPLIASPKPIRVRWLEEVKVISSPDNQVINTVVTVIVDRIIPILSIMWKGHITALPSPLVGVDLYQVLFRKTVPDTKNRLVKYKVFLARYSTTLPEIQP